MNRLTAADMKCKMGSKTGCVMKRFSILFAVVVFFNASVLRSEDIEALKKVIDARALAALPDYLGKKAVPENLVGDAQSVVESADKILAGGNAGEKDKRWALQRKAVALIVLAYADITRYYVPLLQIEDELEKQGLKKLAVLAERHILLIGGTIAVQTKLAAAGSQKGINLQFLADRMVKYAQANPGPEAERDIDLFVAQVRTLPNIARDKRLSVVAPVFQRHYQEINHTAKAAAMQPDIDRSLLTGKPMVLIGADLDGKDFDINSIKDKAVLVQFWGTWCPHCKEEMPELIRLYEKYHDRGLEIIGINTAVKGDENPAAVKKFLQTAVFGEKKIPYTILHEGSAEKKYQMTVSKQYGIDELPVLILIGRSGKVINLHPLPSTLDDLIADALSPGAAVEFTPEERQQIEEAKKNREEEEQRKIDEELSH
ncbi:MAG: TlpA family protein disulfide reductase [Planctomycetaceae bacterium]|jgi:thiol-disulfide isomerase/thioredoxin|nr:TlpA family protein disulfide reductase [Planctomycetaceae bacterium]